MNLKKVVYLFACILLSSSGCSARDKVSKTISESALSDSIMVKSIGDSIYSIITHADKIRFVSLPTPSDSISERLDIKKQDWKLLHFIISNPNSFSSDSKVYGKFTPQLEVNFSSKKKSVVIRYDFGLKKYQVCDAGGAVIRQYDMGNDDMLRFVGVIFPDKDIFRQISNSGKQ